MKRFGGALLWSVLAALAATAWILVAVGSAVVRQAGHGIGHGGLEYATLLRSVDGLLALDTDRAVLRLELTDTVVSGRRLTYDTLVITDRQGSIPSLARGGYLHDEVRRYNTFQRDRVSLAESEPESFSRLAALNPSIFRPIKRADGTVGVGRTAGAWNRRIGSPFADEWRGEVRAADATSGRGLYSAEAALTFERPQRVRTRYAGRSQTCEFEPRGPDAVAFCLSEARMPQAIFRETADAEGHHRVVAGWAPLLVDGRRVRPGDSVAIATGSVVQLEPLKPVVFGEYWQGVLSSRQWINGHMRRRTTATPPLDMLAALGRRPVVPTHPPAEDADLVLSVDARATARLTRELEAFTDRLRVPVEFAAVVLARVPDGEIVAVAEAGSRTEPGRSRLMERLAVGSAVKPLLAAAILTERPDLASLEIPARSGRIRSVLDAPLVPSRRAFTTALNCGMPHGGRVGLEYFLRCSNNEYAAALLVASLQDEGDGPRSASGTISRAQLLRSPVSEGINALYGLATDPVIVDAQRRSERVWTGLSFTDGAPVRLPYEVLPDESRPVLLATPEDEGSPLSLLYRYAFGAWENRWNLFDLTNGFGRVTSDRSMQVRFAGLESSRPETPPTLGLAEHPWYGEYLAGLRRVAIDGTASDLSRRWRAAGLPAAVFAKTGTLTEPGDDRGDGIFIKSLLFAVGESWDVGGPLDCGIVGSVYISFAEGPARGSLPSYQVEFAESRLGEFLNENWSRFRACAEGASDDVGG